MTTDSPLVDGDPAATIADFEHRARRFETACGEGSVVWRAWGSGPPVLLAHGSHGSWSHWIRNINCLAADRTVWALDLPGYGESAMPPRIDHETISQVIAAGLHELIGMQLPIDVVGFSFGGVAGAYLAIFHPGLVRRLVLVDTGGLDTPLGKVELTRVRGLEGDARRAALRANLLSLMLHDPASVDDLALHLQVTNGFRGRLDPVALVLPDRLLDALPKLTVQVDAIWGEYDQPHPNPAAQEEVLRRFHPDMEFHVIPGAGHWVMYEKPDAFNRAICNLLDSPLRRTS